jgi:hypothetical protein
MARILLVLSLLLSIAGASAAADLPPHGPLRVLVVSDEVNPHGLSPAQLTQPGDISAALAAPGSGLNLELVTEIATNDLPTATAALSVAFGDPSAYDVLIYFAHRIPDGPGGAAAQAAFVAAVEDFLEAGGGVVSFHHGSYLTAGKEAMQDIIGATATGAVPWDTVDGQNVINVAPLHFVATNGVEYTGSTPYADVARGVPASTYDFFNNVPDERYVNFEINPGAGTIEVLFASNYDQNGTTHLLGFTHQRPAWAGIVVAYQPGEYQPNALDDLDGNNFQILANAIVYAAGQSGCDCDDDNPCTVDSCGPGGCEHSAEPAGDCDTTWAKGLLVVNERVAGRERLVAKMTRGPALSQTDLGDPLAPGGTAYTLCIYDQAGGLAARLDVSRAGDACGSAACWSSIGGAPPSGKGYRYRDPASASDGMRSMTLKSGGAGTSKLIAKGRNAANLGQTQLPTGIAAALGGSTQATVQVHGSDLSQCFSVTLDTVSSSGASFFKARR